MTNKQNDKLKMTNKQNDKLKMTIKNDKLKILYFH
jgi:hypothetical protein